nr:hypothetical protein [uncultured Brumimicrobium sp.]
MEKINNRIFKELNNLQLLKIKGGQSCESVQRSFLGRTWWVERCTDEKFGTSTVCRTRDDAYA